MTPTNPTMTKLRAARRSLSTSDANLNAAIRAAHSGGNSLRDIADVVGLSHETVRAIVKDIAA